MKQQPADVRAWVRQDLTRRYGTVLREDLPPDMVALLTPDPQRN